MSDDDLHRVHRLAVLKHRQHLRAGIDHDEPARCAGSERSAVEIGEQPRVGRHVAARLRLGPSRVAELRIDRIHIRGLRDKPQATARRTRSAGSDRRSAALRRQHRISVDHAGRRLLDRLDILRPRRSKARAPRRRRRPGCRRGPERRRPGPARPACGPGRSRRTPSAEGSRRAAKPRGSPRRRETRSAGCDSCRRKHATALAAESARCESAPRPRRRAKVPVAEAQPRQNLQLVHLHHFPRPLVPRNLARALIPDPSCIRDEPPEVTGCDDNSVPLGSPPCLRQVAAHRRQRNVRQRELTWTSREWPRS